MATHNTLEKTYQVTSKVRQRLADTITPVSIYLKVRDQYPNAILLESSDYHGNENSFSFICLEVISSFMVDQGEVVIELPDGTTQRNATEQVPEQLQNYVQSFHLDSSELPIKVNGFFGYAAYDAVQYFETVKFKNQPREGSGIPAIRYGLYRYIIAINHFKNELFLIENQIEGLENGDMKRLESLIYNHNFAAFPFSLIGDESSNITDEQFKQMVTKGKEHCYRGDVFQIVLSRQFAQGFEGDEFNVYRALRSINPSPYLFYFDYGSYKIFGSSPEAQLIVSEGKATINPIAGTFRRTGDDTADRELARQLANDPKENAEHVMLVDLARNDLARNANKVEVETYREVQYYSHVIHLVSKVTGKLKPDANVFRVMGDSFPAGTLSGAPKYRAMELIDEYENQLRGYYGGCIGFIGFDNSFNQAIMIRSFMSKNNTLFYQAGAGVVSESVEEKELQEVNNKLAALKKAVVQAQSI